VCSQRVIKLVSVIRVCQTVLLIYVYCCHLVILCVTTKECITECLGLQVEFIVNGEYSQFFLMQRLEPAVYLRVNY
jgi:hypothetical protein